MIAWTRTRTLIAGISLILLANAVALSGVAYNRSGAPESQLTLSQRELGLPYGGGSSTDNSGIALSLGWRVLNQETEHGFDLSYIRSGGAPEWLDKAKLAELGFDVSQPVDTAAGVRQYAKQLAREVLLVLELNGAAYQQSMQRARQHAAQEAAARGTNADSKEYAQRDKNAQEQLGREEQENSRLFVIDAGLHLNALRAKYPDRAKYAIVRGQVRPHLLNPERKARLLGYVSGLSINQITVPFDFRPVFEPLLKAGRGYRHDTTSPFEVSLAFGKRLEPWMTEAKKK